MLDQIREAPDRRARRGELPVQVLSHRGRHNRREAQARGVRGRVHGRWAWRVHLQDVEQLLFGPGHRVQGRGRRVRQGEGHGGLQSH